MVRFRSRRRAAPPAASRPSPASSAGPSRPAPVCGRIPDCGPQRSSQRSCRSSRRRSLPSRWCRGGAGRRRLRSPGGGAGLARPPAAWSPRAVGPWVVRSCRSCLARSCSCSGCSCSLCGVLVVVAVSMPPVPVGPGRGPGRPEPAASPGRSGSRRPQRVEVPVAQVRLQGAVVHGQHVVAAVAEPVAHRHRRVPVRRAGVVLAGVVRPLLPRVLGGGLRRRLRRPAGAAGAAVGRAPGRGPQWPRCAFRALSSMVSTW